MIEAGTTVREMDPMKKEAKEKAFLNSYVSIIQEIPDDRFDQVSVCPAMLLAYKGARKKILEGGMLWRKYKSELNEVRKFPLKFLGVGLVAIAQWNRPAPPDEEASHHQALEGKVSYGHRCRL